MRTGLAGGLLVCLALAGCTKAPPPAVAVKGRVTHANGKPVTHMVVIFTPREDANKASRPNGVLDANGQYELTCVPGRYKVSLAPIPVQVGGSPAGGGDANVGKMPGAGDLKPVPTKYRDAESSPWAVTIAPGQTADVPALTMN